MLGQALDPGAITGYHAHLYYDALTRKSAAKCASASPRNSPPHARAIGMTGRSVRTRSAVPIAFAVGDFPRLVRADAQRGDHLVLVHPLTGGRLRDHAHHALWLGDKLPPTSRSSGKRNAA